MGARDRRRLGRGARRRAAEHRRSAASSSCSPAARWRRRPAPLELPPFPASAAGPDLRQLVLGSEGRLGILTEVVLRATPVPEVDRLDAWAVRDWASAQEAVRDPRPLEARPVDAPPLDRPPRRGRCSRSRAGPAGSTPFEAWLRVRRVAGRLVRCSWSGRPARSASPRRRGRRRARSSSGTAACRSPGSRRPGIATRFRSPYLRNALWAAGYGADTLETATDWSRVPALLAAARGRRSAGALADRGERVHVMTPPVARLPVRLEPVPDVPVPPRAATLTRASTGGAAIKRAAVGHDRRRGWDDQPPPRGRHGPRAVPRGREGRARAWRPSRRPCGRSTRRGS